MEILNEDKIKHLAREMQLQESTEDSIKLARNMTAELESYNPVTRCLVVHAMHKTYTKLFPAVFAAFEKMGV